MSKFLTIVIAVVIVAVIACWFLSDPFSATEAANKAIVEGAKNAPSVDVFKAFTDAFSIMFKALESIVNFFAKL